MCPYTPGRFDLAPLLSRLGKDAKGFPSAGIRSASPNGTSATRFSSIRKGSVKLSLTSRQGKEAVVALLDGGNIFGDTALVFHQSLCPADVIALTDVHGIRIEPDVMLRLIHKDEDVLERCHFVSD
jgi:CRP/FNR family transcriptional regulator, cyclic AMP receptor protein